MLGKRWGRCVRTWPVEVLKKVGLELFFPKAATSKEAVLPPVFNHLDWTLQEVEWPPPPLRLGLRCIGGPAGCAMVKKGGPRAGTEGSCKAGMLAIA